MRAEVWDKFKMRFNIPCIQEYYRSTEVCSAKDDPKCRELLDLTIIKWAMEYGAPDGWVIGG
jgi:hypothetical protein